MEPVRTSAGGFGTLLRLAWPVVLSRASQAVIGFTDAAMVASLGEDAVAAATTGASNSMNLFILPMGVVFIVQSFTAQLVGSGDAVGSRRYAWYGLMVAAASGVLIAAAMPAVSPVVAALGYSASVSELLADYMVLRMASCAAVVGIEALANWYGGLGNTRLPMVINFVAMALNIAFNWVLIYGNLGAPAMGVRGAAIASTLASWLAFALLLGLFVGRFGLGPRPPGGRARLHVAELRRMLRFGLPSGFNWFLEFAAFTFFINFIVADLGTTAVAALMAVVQVNSIAFMPSFGLASAGAILVGQAIGNDRKHEVPGVVRHTMVVCVAWQLLVGTIYASFPATVMSVFESDELGSHTLVELAASLLLISTAWQLFDAVGMTLSEALRAAGDTAWCMWARVVLAWVLFVPLATWGVIAHGMGPVGATACLVVYTIALALVLLWRFRSGAWRRIDLTGSAAPPV
ncbi:MAG: MATE family efflux transporter [Deltaproteobacteria bacterium]|nr:MATE family efflux transporter [Nannocystaceae bacterium]